MKKIISIATLFSLFLLINSCKKKKGDNENLDQNNNNTVEGYMSTVEGSWWLYGTNEGAVVIRSAKGEKATVNNFEYDYYTSTDTNTKWITPEYFAENEQKYLMLIDLTGEQKDYIPAIVTKENPKVGEKWTNTHTMNYQSINFDLLIEGEIVEIIPVMNINGKEYTDVVKVNNALQAKFFLIPQYQDCGNTVMYFSKGIGVLKTEININIMTFYNRNYSDSLLDYHLEF